MLRHAGLGGILPCSRRREGTFFVGGHKNAYVGQTLGHVVSHAVQIRRWNKAMSPGAASRSLKIRRLASTNSLLLRRMGKDITLRDATHHRFSFYPTPPPRYP